MKLDFVIPTFNRPAHLAALLWCLKAQTSPDWTAHVVADCPPEGALDPVMAMFKDEPRIRFTFLPERFNDWGHTPRNFGLERCSEDLVCMTGEDNYYMPTFVEEVIRAFHHPDVSFVYTDMVHNWGKEYIYVPSILFWSHIDIGNSVFRTEHVKHHRLNPKHFSADWGLIEAYVKAGYGKHHHIQKCLYVHN